MFEIQRIANGPYRTNCYLIFSKKGVSLIDAPFPSEPIIRAIDGYKLNNIYLTHAHFDHILALPDLKDEFPDVRIHVSREDSKYLENDGEEMYRMLSDFDPFFASRFLRDIKKIPQADCFYSETEQLEPGLSIIELKGHTMGSIGIYNKEFNILFSGDTLFKNSIGRTDLGGNDAMMRESLKRLKELPPNTTVLPGHGEETTIGAEFF